MEDAIPDEAIGPHMLALTERQRKFAWIMACGEFSAADAARRAGYSDHLGAERVRAHYLMHDSRVLDAIEEASRCVLRGLAPLAIRRAKEVLEDKRHPSHARMIETVLDRTGFFGKTEHKVVVEHLVDMKQLEDFARRLAVETGGDAAKMIGGNVIEGEAVERNEAPDA